MTSDLKITGVEAIYLRLPAGQGAVRQRPGRPDRQGHDRRRDHRLRRGRLQPDGGQGVHRGAVLAHDGDRAGPRR